MKCAVSYNGMFFSHNKNEVLVHATTWMNLEITVSSKSHNKQHIV